MSDGRRILALHTGFTCTKLKYHENDNSETKKSHEFSIKSIQI